jgi:hypothetical protein
MVADSISSAMARDCDSRCTGPALVAEFPVAVVDGGDRAGAHDPLEIIAFKPGDFRDRVLNCHLNFGQRRDRHPGGEVVIKHVVLAHIGVGEDIITQRLAELRRPAQWPSISQA